MNPFDPSFLRPPRLKTGAGRQRQLTTRTQMTVDNDRVCKSSEQDERRNGAAPGAGFHDAYLRALASRYVNDPVMRRQATAWLALLDARGARGVTP